MSDYHEDETTAHICQSTRHPDLPKFKEHITSQLKGELIGFLEGQGLHKGKEFEVKTQEVGSCSKSIIWVWDNDGTRKHQLVIILSSVDMRVEYGVAYKPENKTLFRKKLEGLRYNISTGTDLCLTDGSEIQWKSFLKDIQAVFFQLEKKDVIE